VHRPTRRKGIPSKALLHWDGPFTVTGAPHSNQFECTHDDTGQVVVASRYDVRPHTAAGPSSDVKEALPPEDVVPGDIIATLASSEPSCKEFWLSVARVPYPPEEPDVIITDYLGTRSTRPPWTFTPVYHDAKDDKLLLSKRKITSAHVSRFSGREPVANVIAFKLKLTAAGRLTQESSIQLKDYTPQHVGALST
jgi:hypothetical protein